MLYLFHGTNVAEARAKAFQWIAAARAKEPDAIYLRIDSSSLTAESLSNALQVQGLFYSKALVLLDDPFTDSASADLVLENLSELAASANPIAILAPKLLATRLKKIMPHATKVFEESITEKKPTRGFNSTLVNALGAKDAAALWKEILKAERAGDPPEMIHGLLHWKARDILQKGSRAWGGVPNSIEARALSRSLIELVSDSRSGKLDLALSLERFALSM
jgi:hypothetical protein